jgi:hypothetical protein
VALQADIMAKQADKHRGKKQANKKPALETGRTDSLANKQTDSVHGKQTDRQTGQTAGHKSAF